MSTFPSRMRTVVPLAVAVAVLSAVGCGSSTKPADGQSPGAKADFVLRNTQTHNKFSRRIPAALRVPSGSVIEAFAHEATGGQFSINSSDPTAVNMDLVHTLTGPVMWKAPNLETFWRSSCSRSKSVTGDGWPSFWNSAC